jgi:hypothetical protein
VKRVAPCSRGSDALAARLIPKSNQKTIMCHSERSEESLFLSRRDCRSIHALGLGRDSHGTGNFHYPNHIWHFPQPIDTIRSWQDISSPSKRDAKPGGERLVKRPGRLPQKNIKVFDQDTDEQYGTIEKANFSERGGRKVTGLKPDGVTRSGALAAVSARQTSRRRAVLTHDPFHSEVHPCGPSDHFSYQFKP